MANNVTVYHGTVMNKANRIISEGKFKISTKDNEWLGEGIYFFPLLQDAIWWSKIQERRFSDSPSVLIVNLNYQDHQFLDLDKSSDLTKFESCFKKFLANLREEGQIIPNFSSTNPDEEKKLFCFACNVYRDYHKEIKLLAYTFDRPKETSSGFRYRQRQYCATDNTIIKNITKKAGRIL